jgi:RNA polymerase sigma-70 factor (ECF subfamily)
MRQTLLPIRRRNYGAMMAREKPFADGKTPDDAKLRRYLLGTCDPEESGEIDLAIIDGGAPPILEVIEDELIEDYIAGELDESDRYHFEQRLLPSPKIVEKIKISALLLEMSRTAGVDNLKGSEKPAPLRERKDLWDLGRHRASPLASSLASLEDESDIDQVGTARHPPTQTFDSAYLERLRAEDIETQKHFFAYFRELIRLKLRSRVNSSDAIEDLMQETFARFFAAFRSEGRIKRPERLGAFVNSVCNNVLLEYYRSKPRDRSAEEDEGAKVADPSLEVLSILSNKENKKTENSVRQVLGQLSERDLRLLREIFIERRDQDTVCRDFGVDRNYLYALIRAFRALYLKVT